MWVPPDKRCPRPRHLPVLWRILLQQRANLVQRRVPLQLCGLRAAAFAFALGIPPRVEGGRGDVPRLTCVDRARQRERVLLPLRKALPSGEELEGVGLPEDT